MVELSLKIAVKIHESQSSLKFLLPSAKVLYYQKYILQTLENEINLIIYIQNSKFPWKLYILKIESEDKSFYKNQKLWFLNRIKIR